MASTMDNGAGCASGCEPACVSGSAPAGPSVAGSGVELVIELVQATDDGRLRVLASQNSSWVRSRPTRPWHGAVDPAMTSASSIAESNGGSIQFAMPIAMHIADRRTTLILRRRVRFASARRSAPRSTIGVPRVDVVV
jgi:hypothetical protein